jgi:hypothetical protein
MLALSKFAEGDQPMKPQLFATSLFTLATFAFSPLSASAQTEPISATEQVAETRGVVLLHVSSPREHEDVAVTQGQALDVSPRSHDDWALAPAIESLDLSHASHDNWAL